MEKVLSKISKAELGRGGYQGAMFGLNIEFATGGSDFRGGWQSRPAGAEWTVESRRMDYGKVVEFISDITSKAKVSNLSELVGAPVELTLNGGRLESWRILEEVL